MINVKKLGIPTAKRSPIRETRDHKKYCEEKTDFFRKLENLCTSIYDFQNLNLPDPP